MGHCAYHGAVSAASLCLRGNPATHSAAGGVALGLPRPSAPDFCKAKRTSAACHGPRPTHYYTPAPPLEHTLLTPARPRHPLAPTRSPLGTYNIRQSIYTRAPSCVAWSRRSRAAYQAAAAAATGTQSITLTCQLAGLPAGKTGVRRLRVTVLAEVAGVRVSAAWDLAYKLNGLVANGTFKQMVRAQKKTAFVPRLGDGFCVEGIMTCPPALPSMGS